MAHVHMGRQGIACRPEEYSGTGAADPPPPFSEGRRCVQHRRRRRGGTPRGSSTTCEQRDNGPTLPWGSQVFNSRKVGYRAPENRGVREKGSINETLNHEQRCWSIGNIAIFGAKKPIICFGMTTKWTVRHPHTSEGPSTGRCLRQVVRPRRG